MQTLLMDEATWPAPTPLTDEPDHLDWFGRMWRDANSDRWIVERRYPDKLSIVVTFHDTWGEAFFVSQKPLSGV